VAVKVDLSVWLDGWISMKGSCKWVITYRVRHCKKTPTRDTERIAGSCNDKIDPRLRTYHFAFVNHCQACQLWVCHPVHALVDVDDCWVTEVQPERLPSYLPSRDVTPWGSDALGGSADLKGIGCFYWWDLVP
jgi:hypothetical protein